MAKAKTAVLDCAVSFGKVSFGDEVASVSIHIERRNLAISQADKSLCGRRLRGHIDRHDQTDEEGQKTLDDFDKVCGTVSGSFDIGSISVTRKKIGATLSFAISEIDVFHLAEFAKRTGRLVVEEVEDIPAGKDRAEPKDE